MSVKDTRARAVVPSPTYIIKHTDDATTVLLPPTCEVPQGKFIMGEDTDHRDVYVDNFWVSKYPVTVAEYRYGVRAGAVRRPTAWAQQLRHSSHPVVYVSWYDAVLYAAWLSAAMGEQWRLPTEAEWEKAARGTDGRLYPWGNDQDITRANTSENDVGGTSAVGAYPAGASPYGALDMAGNVWEWCSSLYMPYPYRSDDGREDVTTRGNRVARGGPWYVDSRYTRVTYRDDFHPAFVSIGLGFRLVKDSDRARV